MYRVTTPFTATITPDRGDRPQFMAFCNSRIDLIKSWSNSVISIKIVDPPKSNAFDLISRFKKGIEIAKEWGIDKVVIVESDDFYPVAYLDHVNLDDYDFYGWSSTWYYNIRRRQYQRNYHEGHSSLFCTAFKISALKEFVWPPDDYVWLDIALWKYAAGRRMFLNPDEPPCIGIKHNVGKVAGKAHKFELKHSDPELSWLKSKVDAQAFEFYSNLKF